MLLSNLTNLKKEAKNSFFYLKVALEGVDFIKDLVAEIEHFQWFD
jgi:hypothetical protein